MKEILLCKYGEIVLKGASATISGVMPWIFSVFFHFFLCTGFTRVSIMILPVASVIEIEIISS